MLSGCLALHMLLLVLPIAARAPWHRGRARLVHPKGCTDFPSVASSAVSGSPPALPLLSVPLGLGYRASSRREVKVALRQSSRSQADALGMRWVNTTLLPNCSPEL